MKLLLGLVALVAGAAAQDWVATPDGGEALLSADSFPLLRSVGSAGKAEAIDVEGMPFPKAYRVTVAGIPRNASDSQLMANTAGDVRQGDVPWFSLFARGSSQSEDGEAYGIAHLQRRTGNNEKIASMPFRVGTQWKQFMMPVRVSATLPSGEHNYTIFLGYPNQTVEIGGVILVNYRDTRTVADLPRTKIGWPGSAPDAPWRQTAAERIDKIRKAGLRVRVVDADGRPLRGAQVRVAMTRHEFGFGSAVAADGIFSQAPDSHAYREVIRTWFNKIVLENDLKWPSWEANRNRVGRHQRAVLGHRPAEDTRRRGDGRVVQEGPSARARRAALHQRLQHPEQRRARRRAPEPLLRDYWQADRVGSAGRRHRHAGPLRRSVDRAHPPLADPRPLRRIRQADPGDRVRHRHRRRGGAGRLHARFPDRRVRASLGGRFHDVGFWEGRHWRPRAAMFRRDWSLKPNAHAFYDLVHREWSTKEQGATNEQGVFDVRGFKGDYDIEVSLGGRTVARKAKLTGQGREVTVTLP